ncbi:MAG: hypothetical protein NTU41_00900 [Chloroflexi bacterium]|nr:hypothetical protein [Chloroflexota bacterium]
MKLRRVTSGGAVQTLTVPRHKDMDPHTLRAVFRQAARFVPESQLHSHF